MEEAVLSSVKDEVVEQEEEVGDGGQEYLLLVSRML